MDLALAPRAAELASTLDASLPDDVAALLEDLVGFRARSRPALAAFHRDFLRSERTVR